MEMSYDLTYLRRPVKRIPIAEVQPKLSKVHVLPTQQPNETM